MAEAKPTIVLVANELSASNAWSNTKITAVTKAGELLMFEDAKKKEIYMDGGTTPAYSSTSFDHFEGLPDKACEKLFGKVLGKGDMQNTGLRLGGTITVANIFAWRDDKEISFAELGARTKDCAKIILLACRAL